MTCRIFTHRSLLFSLLQICLVTITNYIIMEKDNNICTQNWTKDITHLKRIRVLFNNDELASLHFLCFPLLQWWNNQPFEPSVSDKFQVSKADIQSQFFSCSLHQQKKSLGTWLWLHHSIISRFESN